MKTLPLNLFWNLGRYPSFTFHTDQWGEHGWVYDTHSDRYLAYDIDRKDQHDSVRQVRTRAEMIARVIPGAKPELKAWFASFTTARTDTDVYILTAGSIRRFPLGELQRDAYNRPRQEVVEVEADEVPAAVRMSLGLGQ